MEAETNSIAVFTTIRHISERFKEEYVSGVGADALFKKVSQGWYVWFHNSHELLYMGDNPPPNWNEGDTVKITFTKELPCPPSTNTTQPTS